MDCPHFHDEWSAVDVLACSSSRLYEGRQAGRLLAQEGLNKVTTRVTEIRAFTEIYPWLPQISCPARRPAHGGGRRGSGVSPERVSGPGSCAFSPTRAHPDPSAWSGATAER